MHKALSKISKTKVCGAFYRQVSFDEYKSPRLDLPGPHPGPLASPLQQPALDLQCSGRWHYKGDMIVQYLADRPDAVWAEMAKRFRLTQPEMLEQQKADLWEVWVDEVDIADLGCTEKMKQAGLPTPMSAVDHDITRQLGRLLFEAGFQGVLAPSAALEGSVCLTLFGGRYSYATTISPAVCPKPPARPGIPCVRMCENSPLPRDLCPRTIF